MIRVVFPEHDGVPVGFELRGHAGAGQTGNDIVCAAVSSAAYMTANTITDVLMIRAEIELDEGYLKVTVPEDQRERSAVVLQGFRLHLTQLTEQYPENIHIRFAEV